MQSLVDQLDLNNITLFCQDWGGLIGLRLVAANPERFARVAASNTMLPTGDHDPGESFRQWQQFSQKTVEFNVSGTIKSGTTTELSPATIDAYNAPFPDESYKEGARQFPLLVPITPDDPASEPNRAAWKELRKFTKPFITLFSDSDPITAGGDRVMQKLIPGTKAQSHSTIINAGHFLQEDQGKKVAELLVQFIADNPK